MNNVVRVIYDFNTPWDCSSGQAYVYMFYRRQTLAEVDSSPRGELRNKKRYTPTGSMPKQYYSSSNTVDTLAILEVPYIGMLG